MQVREQWIDAARGTALILVVFYHSCLLLTKADFHLSAWVLSANAILDGFRMPTLIMVSGLLAAPIRKWPWRDVWRRRAAPVLVLYLIWGVILTVAFALVQGRTLGVNTVQALLLLPVRPYQLLWYLMALALYILLARGLRKVATVPLVVCAAAVSVASFALWPTEGLPNNMQWWGHIAVHWVYFVAAERFARNYHQVVRRTGPGLAIVAGLAFFGAGAVMWKLGMLGTFGQPRAAIATLIISVLGTLFTLSVFPLIAHARVLTWARAIGRDSLGVYATHYVIVAALVVVAERVLDGVQFRGLGTVTPVAIAVAGVAVAYALTRTIKRWAPVPLLKPWWDTKASERRAAHAPAQ